MTSSGEVRESELTAYLREQGFDVPSEYGEITIKRTNLVEPARRI
jgi:hypothetical protein